MTTLEVLNKAKILPGNVIQITSEQLDRKVYLEVKSYLEGIGGKWKTKVKGFKFEHDPEPYMDDIRAGKKVNLKQQFQFFPTPPAIVEKIKRQKFYDAKRVLEPSAGKGALLDIFPPHVIDGPKTIDYCELNDHMVDYLKANYPQCNFKGNDFMDLSTTNKYDLIVANPPFTKDQYVDHIMKMYEHLESPGRLIAVMPIGYTFASRGKGKTFREWMEHLKATGEAHIEIIENDKGDFKSSGTMIKTHILVLDK